MMPDAEAMMPIIAAIATDELPAARSVVGGVIVAVITGVMVGVFVGVKVGVGEPFGVGVGVFVTACPCALGISNVLVIF